MVPSCQPANTRPASRSNFNCPTKTLSYQCHFHQNSPSQETANADSNIACFDLNLRLSEFALQVSIQYWCNVQILKVTLHGILLTANLHYLISLQKWFPIIVIDCFPSLFIWFSNTIVQVSKPYYPTASWLTNTSSEQQDQNSSEFQRSYVAYVLSYRTHLATPKLANTPSCDINWTKIQSNLFKCSN